MTTATFERETVSMLAAELLPGRQYGVRIHPRAVPREPLIHVQLLEKVGRCGKSKVRHLDGPHTGLEEFLSSRQFVCAWGDRKPFLRDEERLDAKERAVRERDRVIEEAVDLVMHTTGEHSIWINNQGLFEGNRDAVERVTGRAALEITDLDPQPHTDRHGHMFLSPQAGLRLAQAFAAAEPDGVHLYIEAQEAEYKARGFGERFYHDYLLEQRPAFALARQWAGHQAEVDQLRMEVDRLRSLVESAAYDLERVGAQRQATALRRRLKSGR